MDNEGGYPIPDHVAIWLLRLRLFEVLNQRAEGNKLYFFDWKGFHHYQGEEA